MNRFEHDALGRRVRTMLPGGQSEGFAYDAAGNMIRHTNFNGVVLASQYDALNRLTNPASAGYQTAFTYSPTGQRAPMSDPSGNTTFAYDIRDRLATNSGPAGTLVYDSDGNGNVRYLTAAQAFVFP